MRSVDIYSPPASLVAEVCSCAECDSFHCFGLRHHQGIGCFCKRCCTECPLYENLKIHLDSSKDFKSSEPKPGSTSMQMVSVYDTSKQSGDNSASSSVHDKNDTTLNKIVKIPLAAYGFHDKTDFNNNKKEAYVNVKLSTEQPHIYVFNSETNNNICIQDEHKQCIMHRLKEITNCPEAKEFIRNCVQEELRKIMHKTASKQIKYREKESDEEYLEREIDTKDKEATVLKETVDTSTSFSGFIRKVKSYLVREPASQASTTNQNESKNDEEGNCKNQKDKDIKEFVQDIEKQLLEAEKDESNLQYTDKAELTAQIMNVPLDELELYKLKKREREKTKLDLFKRLKDIYNACTCLVCECIPTRSQVVSGDACNCKPCECDDCKKLKKNDRMSKNQGFGECETKNGSSMDSNLGTGKCKLCECLAYYKSLEEECVCKPCECVQCASTRLKTRRTYIVAPAGRGQRSSCTCDPCACFECASVYPLSRNRTTQEMGTDVSRHLNCHCETCNNDNCESEGADTCTCDRHKRVMQKPVVKDSNEYDIRLASTVNCNDKFGSRHKKKSKMQRDTLTMFATVPHQLGRRNIESGFSKRLCSDLEDNLEDNPSISKNVVLKKVNILREPCDCKPCDCIKCKKHFLERHIPSKNKDCLCEICDCINCATLSVTYDIENKYRKSETRNRKEVCNCKPCECLHCRKYISDYPYKLNYSQLHDEHEEYSSYSRADDGMANYASLLKEADSDHYIDLILANKESKSRPDVKKKVSDDIKKRNSTWEQKNIVECSLYPSKLTSKTYASKPCSSSSYYDKNEIDRKTTEEDWNSPVLKHLETSMQDSNTNRKSNTSICDSAGRDYSDFLMSFPTRTAETCINEVMNFDRSKNCEVTYVKEAFSADVVSNIKKCKNWNSENPCDCKPCDCDNCVFKVPKQEACRCDCSKCYCEGTCLSDRVIWIRKNETTQTFVMPSNEKLIPEYQSSYFVKSVGNFRPLNSSNQEIDKYMEFRALAKTVTFGKVDSVVRNANEIANKPKNEDFEFNYTTLANRDVSSGEINYKNVEKTINNAKQMSLDLLKILAKYQKANKEFNSVTEKYRLINESPTKINAENNEKTVSTVSNSELRNNSTVNDLINVIVENFDTSEKSVNYSNDNINTTPSEYNDTSQIGSSQKDSAMVFSTLEDDSRNRIPNTTKEINSDEDNDDITDLISIDNSYKSFKNNKIMFKDRRVIFKERRHHHKLEEMKNKTIEELKSELLYSSKQINKAMMRCRQEKWKPETNENSVTDTAETDLVKNYIYSYEEEEEENPIVYHDAGYTWSLHKEDMRSRSKSIPEDDEENYDLPEKLSSANTANTEKSISQVSEEQPLLSKGLLFQERFGSTPMVNPKTWKISDGGVKSNMTTNAPRLKQRTSNPLKVTFHTIRRISDHTVLIKWRAPDDIEHVQGYELLVDGQAVQRFMSPTRTMAVVTCLPHTDKVLFTIRTIVTDDVYDPQMKSPCASYVYNLVK